MKKIIFEGTESQIELLKEYFEILKKGHNEDRLPILREDYQTENLWCIEDVKSKFNCTDEKALEVLEQALTNEATIDQICFAINFHAEDLGL